MCELAKLRRLEAGRHWCVTGDHPCLRTYSRLAPTSRPNAIPTHAMKTSTPRPAPIVRHLFFLFGAVLATGLPLEVSGQALDVSGAWVLTVESPNGTGRRDVRFVQDGGDISGEISSSRAAGPLLGTVDGHDVTFIAEAR